jgi:hypothetical protein
LIGVFNRHPIVSAIFTGHEHLLAHVHLDESRVSGLSHPVEQFGDGSTGGPIDNRSCLPHRTDYCFNDTALFSRLGFQYGFLSVDVDAADYTVSLYIGAELLPVKSWTFHKQGAPTATPSVTNSPTEEPTATPTGLACRSDVSEDGGVDFNDFLLLANEWNTGTGGTYDLNQDGIINTLDLGTVIYEWGSVCQ